MRHVLCVDYATNKVYGSIITCGTSVLRVMVRLQVGYAFPLHSEE
jgi:hypothetical protein